MGLKSPITFSKHSTGPLDSGDAVLSSRTGQSIGNLSEIYQSGVIHPWRLVPDGAVLKVADDGIGIGPRPSEQDLGSLLPGGGFPE